LLKRAVFLDRDDTIIKDKSYLSDPDGIEILPRAAESIRLLNDHGLPVIMITNQSGIARGIFTEERLHAIHKRLLSLLGDQGAKIDAIYYCPHHPEGTVKGLAVSCSCRKPNPGMLLQAAKDFGLDLPASFMIGDKPDDIEVIHKVGGKGVLVQTGNHHDMEHADFIAEDLLQAAEWVLKEITE